MGEGGKEGGSSGRRKAAAGECGDVTGPAVPPDKLLGGVAGVAMGGASSPCWRKDRGLTLGISGKVVTDSREEGSSLPEAQDR